jgi:hypothetical protein
MVAPKKTFAAPRGGSETGPGRGLGNSKSSGASGVAKSVSDAATKAASKQAAEALKKSGLAKLNKLNKTTSEAHILSAVKQGKLTAKEAAAINPEKFAILVNPKIVSSKTIKLK